jgi:hypothetical protein
MSTTIAVDASAARDRLEDRGSVGKPATRAADLGGGEQAQVAGALEGLDGGLDDGADGVEHLTRGGSNTTPRRSLEDDHDEALVHLLRGRCRPP